MCTQHVRQRGRETASGRETGGRLHRGKGISYRSGTDTTTNGYLRPRGAFWTKFINNNLIAHWMVISALDSILDGGPMVRRGNMGFTKLLILSSKYNKCTCHSEHACSESAVTMAHVCRRHRQSNGFERNQWLFTNLGYVQCTCGVKV